MRQRRLFRREEGCLTSAVGVTAEPDAVETGARQRRSGGPESGAVAGGAGRRRRAAPTRLAKGQVAAKHRDAPGCQRVGQRDEERAVGRRAGAVREHEAVPGAARSRVERSVDRQPLGCFAERHGRAAARDRARSRPDPEARQPGAPETGTEDGVTGSVVFFDVAGTLIRVRDGVGAQYARVAGRFGVAPDPKALEREFPRAFRAAPLMAFPGAPAESVPRLEREVWRGIVREVFAGAGHLAGFAAGGFDAYFDAVYRHFEDPATWDVFPDVVPALSALRALGCPLGIVSNFDSRVLRILEGLGLAPWFQSVTLSSQVGATKPSRAIFARALAQHGVDAARAFHVGDSPAEDCEGARAAGMRAVLIDRSGRHAPSPDVVRVDSLAHLAGIVRDAT